MHIFTSVCKNLGAPIATDKTQGPTTYITYLGLGINSVSQTLFIPFDKVTPLTEQVNEINNHRKVISQQLQSLCGLLAFCSRSLPPAHAFIRRFYGALAGAHKPHHMIRINSEIKQDAMTLLKFLHHFNGTCQFPGQLYSSDNDLLIFTDSAKLTGGGVYFHGEWAYIPWPNH